MDTIRTDTWTISMPEDWIEKGVTEGGALHFESSDGEKAMYISTWNLGENYLTPPVEVAASFMATDLNALNNMEGYQWQSIAEQVVQKESTVVNTVDSLAESKNYRIVSKILVALPVVVRASFHDYACVSYNTSKVYLAPIIESLSFYALAEQSNEIRSGFMQQ